MRGIHLASLIAGAACIGAFACSGTSNTSGFEGKDSGASGDDGQGPGDDSSGLGDDSPSFGEGGPDAQPQDSGPPPEVAVVYAHSPNVLYKLDPKTKAVTVVGPFSGCSSVIDIAIDENNDGYVTTFGGVYKVDLKTAACTQIAQGGYPNSLSFVPKGTLDPNVEALVGYFGDQYVRIDTTTGQLTNVGAPWNNGLQSSGDIVSVKNGGTFLTVNGAACSDCLVQVDPKTGAMIQNYGSVNHQSVFGLAFWAGTAYGFDNAGEIFSIAWQNGKLVTTNIPVPNPPPNLQFWGAGSTTSAPPTDNDGGGIPIK